MWRFAPLKLCGLILLLCFTTVMAFNFFSSSNKKTDERLAKRQFFDDNDDFVMGDFQVADDNRDDDDDEYPEVGGLALDEEEEEPEKEYKRKGHGKLYTDNHRIVTKYTTVTGSCIQAEDGQHYYTQYNNIQRYFQMGIYGRPNVGAGFSGRALSTPFSLQQQPTCDADQDWAAIRNHWNAIFFGDYKVGGYQQTLGPLAVRGDFRANDYVISTNHQFQCSVDDNDVRLANTAFVVGGSVAGSVIISRGMSYVNNLANSVRVSGNCNNAKQGNGPVDWRAYYNYWTNLSEALSQLMPTHYIDNNKAMNTVNPGTTNQVNVFTFNTCNGFNCPLWPGLLSTPDNIFSGYDTWDGPVGRYPSSGTLLFNIPVDDGTTFNIDSIHPSINADYCRTIYNVYPSDADGNYLPGGHITIRRNTIDMIRGLFLAPLGDIQDGPTGRFGGMVVGDNYSWQQTQGVEIDDWAAAANGAYYCSRFTGCVVLPTPTTSGEPVPEPTETSNGGEGVVTDSINPTPTAILTTDCPECPGPETVTDCQTTVSQCTATSCTATETLAPNTVTVSTTGDCIMTPPVTVTEVEVRTDYVVSTESDCTATETHNIPGPTLTVTEVISGGGELVVPTVTETLILSTCPPSPNPDCTITDEFCLDLVTTTEPAVCTDYATVITSVTCTETDFNPLPGMCTDTLTSCYPTPTRPLNLITVTHTHTQTVTYVPGCDDYRYPNCDDFEEGGDGDGDGDGDGGGEGEGEGEGEGGGGGGGGGDDGDGDDDDDYDYFKKHGKKHHHQKKHRWNKKKKMHDEEDYE